MATDEFYYPLITKVSVQFFFPPEIIDACLFSNFSNMSSKQGYIVDQPLIDGHPDGSSQGIFTFDNNTHLGLWLFDPSAFMQDDQDNSCERVVLKGTIKAMSTSNQLSG